MSGFYYTSLCLVEVKISNVLMWNILLFNYYCRLYKIILMILNIEKNAAITIIKFANDISIFHKNVILLNKKWPYMALMFVLNIPWHY